MLLADISVSLIILPLMIPMILRKVPPNRFYGFKTPVLFHNRTRWYRVNQRSGIILAVLCLIQIAAVLLGADGDKSKGIFGVLVSIYVGIEILIQLMVPNPRPQP